MDEAPANRRPAATPRFRATRWHLPADPLLGLVEVPGGAFTMDGGGSPHQVELPDFWIARFPTTVAQYRAFVAATDVEPGSADCLAGPDDHPVNWLTWYEAMAYCGWLELEFLTLAATTSLTGEDPAARLWRGMLNGTLRVSLPSEAEWEKAARGTAGGAFPWGDDFNAGRCNTKETGIGATSPVGSFPDGVSPYGLYDMSGNVWCYLRTVWGPSLDNPTYEMPYDASDGREDIDADPSLLRCARGGAFTVEPERAKSVFRDAIPTDSRDDADGFRIVISSQAAQPESDAT